MSLPSGFCAVTIRTRHPLKEVFSWPKPKEACKCRADALVNEHIVRMKCSMSLQCMMQKIHMPDLVIADVIHVLSKYDNVQNCPLMWSLAMSSSLD